MGRTYNITQVTSPGSNSSSGTGSGSSPRSGSLKGSVVSVVSGFSADSGVELDNVKIFSLTPTDKTGDHPKLKFFEDGKEVINKEVEIAAAAAAKKSHHVSKIQIWWSFMSFVITVADVVVIIYLSYIHFSHQSDLIAWLMLLPILLNFIGIFTFLSNEPERRAMENLGCERVKNFMFLPVFGPAFSSLRLFVYTLQESNPERTERLESLLTKMKQYESFFRAAPEAFIQITFRIITWETGKVFHSEDHWVSLCIALCVFTLAESNMYAAIMPYYQMFHQYDPTKDKWKVDHIPLNWRVGLFFFAYCTIYSRIMADAIFKATACFVFADNSFGEVIVIAFLAQFILRAGLYAFVTSLASKKGKLKVFDEGVYGAFTYAWKSLFMSFDFTSNSRGIFFWFYLETILMIATSYGVVLAIDVDLSEKVIYHFYSGGAVVACAIAICLKFGLRYRWLKREGKNRISDQNDRH